MLTISLIYVTVSTVAAWVVLSACMVSGGLNKRYSARNALTKSRRIG